MNVRDDLHKMALLIYSSRLFAVGSYLGENSFVSIHRLSLFPADHQQYFDFADSAIRLHRAAFAAMYPVFGLLSFRGLPNGVFAAVRA